MKAQRQLAMMQLRAEAASSKSVALALLAADFGAKIAAARAQHRGPALEAALSALMREQRAAEQGLHARLAGEVATRRKALAKAYGAGYHALRLAVRFRQAAEESTRRGGRYPARPRGRVRGTRAPRQPR